MEWLSLIPLVLKLVGYIEDAFGDAKGQGAVKKSTVMGATQVIVEGMSKASTGGQKETWQNLGPVVDKTIDAAVAIAKTAGWDKITDDMAVAEAEQIATDQYDRMKGGL